MPQSSRYLGIPFTTGKFSSKLFTSLINKVKDKINHWQTSSISYAGRAALINSVSSTLSSYVMNCYKLPKAVLKAINSEQTRFWWGKKNKKFCRWLKLT